MEAAVAAAAAAVAEDAVMIDPLSFIPRLIMQFHITGRCNLRCKHCYRCEGDIEPLTTEDVFSVIQQFEELQDAFGLRYCLGAHGHINLTGGEPFIREDIDKLLLLLKTKKERFSFGILSNGTMLTKDMIALLKECGVHHVQLSIDGCRETHDQLRAPGDYDRTFRKARELEAAGIMTHISFTANRSNLKDLPKIAAVCRQKRISVLWSDRLVPIGHGAELEDLTIGAEQLPAYLATLRKARGGWLVNRIFPHTEVRMNRALQCLGGGGAYHCNAGIGLITVDEMGNIMPCRRMPILCGDIFHTTLKEVWQHHPVFTELQQAALPLPCMSCTERSRCNGGAKCQSYAVYGDFNRPDPACPLNKKTE